MSADDVVVDGGNVASGNGGPEGGVKDVGIRADRADGFVLRNLTVRHVNEHAIYVLESDGYLLDRFKTFYAGEYGVLTFVEDHGLIQNCGRRATVTRASTRAPAPTRGPSGRPAPTSATARRFASATPSQHLGLLRH